MVMVGRLGERWWRMRTHTLVGRASRKAGDAAVAVVVCVVVGGWVREGFSQAWSCWCRWWASWVRRTASWGLVVVVMVVGL